MAIIEWDGIQTKSAVFSPGDVIEISRIAIGYWETRVSGSEIVLLARAEGSLTLRSADGSPLTPSQLAISLPNNGKFYYVADSTAVTGGDGNDLLQGNAQDNTLNGGAGEDYLQGNDGNDTLAGGDGDNYLFGNGGDDRLTGGPGDDLLNGGTGNDVLDSGGGDNFLIDESGDDRYIIRSRGDFIFDNGGNDSAIIYADWYKTSSQVEHWEWAPGVQKLPYWIDALHWHYSTFAPSALREDPVVYYSFAQQATDYSSESDRNGFQPFNPAQITYARQALDYISTIINVRFEETLDTTEPFSIVMGNNQQEDSSGYASPIWHSSSSGLLIDNVPSAKYPGRDGGAYLNGLLLHELGHSLGLRHPFSHPGAGGGVEEPPYLPDAEDNTSATLMSYTGDQYLPDLAYSPLDIAALQYLWGVAPQARAGDSRYVLSAEAAQMIWDGSGVDTIDGAALKADLTLYLAPGYWSHAGRKADLITAAGQYTINFGTQIEHAIGGAGNDRIIGNALDNQLTGGEGNDVLEGGQGNDRLEGGAGIDTAVFGGAYSAHTVTRSANGWTVTGADGSDTLAGIERLRFPDAMVALDTGKDGVAGQVYRLYQAAFDRKPDAGGLAYWMGQADKGASVTSIADSFLRSEEFSKLYGGANPTPETYLAQLYGNVLHRPYDQAGYDYWLGVMKQGVARTDVLLSFAASDENVDAVAKVIGQGFDYTYSG